MMPWMVLTGISLFLNIFNILFSIARSPTIENISVHTLSWALGIYFFLVVCNFKAQLEKGKRMKDFLDLATLEQERNKFVDTPL